MSVTSVAQKWVSEAAGLTQPSRVVWCDGSKAEYDSLIEAMLQDGTLLPLNPQHVSRTATSHRSHPSDVARTEQLTFICTREKRRRRAHQQLDGAGRGQVDRRRPSSRGSMQRSDDVRHPVSHGPGGLAR